MLPKINFLRLSRMGKALGEKFHTKVTLCKILHKKSFYVKFPYSGERQSYERYDALWGIKKTLP